MPRPHRGSECSPQHREGGGEVADAHRARAFPRVVRQRENLATARRGPPPGLRLPPGRRRHQEHRATIATRGHGCSQPPARELPVRTSGRSHHLGPRSPDQTAKLKEHAGTAPIGCSCFVRNNE